MYPVQKLKSIQPVELGIKTTLVLGPLAAAAGVAMPLMNGDDEEFLTSNCEKLSAILKLKPKLILKILPFRIAS